MTRKRILWFSVTPSLFNRKSNSHNGGGWIAALEQVMRGDPSMELGIAFRFEDHHFKHETENVTYYPIPREKRSWTQRLFGKREEQEKQLKAWLDIVEDFKPDLIQIFGSENDFGLLIPHVQVPVVIHMQGCLPPYHNAIYPVGMNRLDFLLHRGLPWRKRLMGWRSEPSFKKRAEREIQIIRSCRHFMGRTEWDKGLVELFNPAAAYYHCEEVLRDSFLRQEKRWQYREEEKLNLISVISAPWYKGADLILKTAALLKRFGTRDYEWNVYGVPDLEFFESKYGVRAADAGVVIRGTASKEELADALCRASCYIHASYIDNSPNSLCEAQLLGVPVLATHVGGIPSLVKDGETGLLYPANDPYTLASLILKTSRDRALCERLGAAEREAAGKRHDPDGIRRRLSAIYDEIISREQ